ncbi:hypothetical protein VE01_09677 [Pseudogymnoascus verrucosus]|uniref:Uncharacterized protein n=1 Tax=Pseudogymnoascus verrucosus TaxID=342668 RepID=A0A1B8G9U5_9PEZI|nr:uncharacterized protein VE01_09677 [Pseudogymnoascus verrucosus]OBT92591.1 hypothetical protein VE01_09677 [Pseudogymnoascus verrucosus]
MAPVGQDEGGIFSKFVETLRGVIRNIPPSPSSLPSGQQPMAWPSDTTGEESSSPSADPERISIRALWPHEPDLPLGSSSTSQYGLPHALGHTQVEHMYIPSGVERIQQDALDALNSLSVVHTTDYETLAGLSSTAGQQVLPSKFFFEHYLSIAKFRENNEGAITFDDDDDEEFFFCLGPPNGRRHYSPPPILDTSSESLPGDMDQPFYDWDEVFDSNTPVSKELDPAAPVFEYQPSHAYIQDTAPGAYEQALQPQHPISELLEPEFPAKTVIAPDPGVGQQPLQSQDSVSEPPEPELPTQALSAPAPQRHAPQQYRAPPLRHLPFHPDNIRKRKEAELRAQRQRQGNGDSNGSANGNGNARSQKSQNGNASSGPSQGPYRPTGSNGFLATATPSRGSSGSSHSMAHGSHNGSSGFQRARNGSFNPLAASPSPSSSALKLRSNPPSPTRSGPSKRPKAGSNSPKTTATTDAGLSTTPTLSSSPPHKFKKTAGSSNLLERPPTPGPSGEPRTKPATKGKAKTHTKAASPPRSPPAPTTGTTGVPAATTRPNGGHARGRTRRQSPPAQVAGVSTSTGQNSAAAPRSPTQMPTQTRASNGTAGAGPSTAGSGVPVEPARINGQESVVTTRPPMPRPTQTSTGDGVADAGPSAGESSPQVRRTGREVANALFEQQVEKHRRLRSMGGYKKLGG